MGINVIVKGLIAMFLIGLIYLSLTSTIVNLANDPTLFGGELNDGTMFLKDNVLLIYYTAGLISFFSIIIWMFNASSASGVTSSLNY